MIAFLKGTLAQKSLSSAYVDVAGVGYQVLMSQDALSKLGHAGDAVCVLTYLHVSDAGIALYGFLSEEEKAAFEKLIGVSGIGPKMALAALSTFSPAALANAISAKDATLISKIPGVGKKTAQRIILELQGSLDEIAGAVPGSTEDAPALSAGAEGAVEALLSMGFTSAEVDLALKGAPEGAGEGALVRYALKRLGS